MKKTAAMWIRTAAAMMIRNCVRGIALCGLVCLAASTSYGQAVLLQDIADYEDLTINEYSSLTTGDGRMYFIGNGNELWTSSIEDPEALIMLRKFSSLSNLTKVGGSMYFVADDGVSGAELWRSKGTAGSTVLVKDILPGAAGSFPEQLTNLRGVLYFVANDGSRGKELWKSNGSPRGTMLVKDIMPRGGNSNPTALTPVGEMLFFAAKDATHGTELWKTNGTATGTTMVKDIRTGTGINSSPSDLVNVYGTLFFVAADAAAGRELWKSDGTTTGTVLVKDIAPGADYSRISNGTAVYRTLFFTATDGIHGQELWKSDGTQAGTMMVKDMTPGPEGSQGEDLFTFQMGNFTNIYGTLFFTAYQNDAYYIWKSDGTTTGTVPIRRAYGPGILQPLTPFIYHNNRIYYFNRTSDFEWDATEFWSMDRTGADHQLIAEFFHGDPYNAYYPEVALGGDNFYLSGQPDHWYGFKMLISDGTREGTRWIQDIRTTTQGSDPKEFTPLNGKLYFVANHPAYGYDNLHVTDGTPAGTEYVVDFGEDVAKLEVMGNTIFAASTGSLRIFKIDFEASEPITVYREYWGPPIDIFTHAGNHLFFSTNYGGFWTSDGTEAGTEMLRGFHAVMGIYPVDDKVLFTVMNHDGSLALWSSDGTKAGTRIVKALRTVSAIDNYYHPHVVMQGAVYFLANDGVHGSELWRSDGTAAGTYMVMDLNTHDPASQQDIRGLILFEDALYISALGDDGKWAVYKSDGTAAGTIKLKDVDPIVHSIVTGDNLLFFTDTDDAGNERADLWITDGSVDGTQMVADLDALYGTFSHALVDGVAYFSFLEGGQLWRTDGTACGTFIVDVGSRGASPISALGNLLIFGSYDEQAGFEPHAYNTAEAPGNPCSRTVASAHASTGTSYERGPAGYPNPFINDFSFRITGDEGETTRLKVFTLYGEPVEDVGELEANTEHRIGQSWPKGVYVLQVMKRGMIEQYRVVKE